MFAEVLIARYDFWINVVFSCIFTLCSIWRKKAKKILLCTHAFPNFSPETHFSKKLKKYLIKLSLYSKLGKMRNGCRNQFWKTLDYFMDFETKVAVILQMFVALKNML